MIRAASMSAPAIRRYALIGQPQILWRRAGLEENVDRHAAARIPITADPEPARLDRRAEAVGDQQRAALMKAAVVAERAEEQLQRLALDDMLRRHIIDDEMREIGLAGERAETRELRRVEADEIDRARIRIGDALEHRVVGRSGQGGFPSERRQVAIGALGFRHG